MGKADAKRGTETALAESQEQAPYSDVAPLGRRLNRAFGPIAAGMLIDLVDLATFGPIGYVLGLPIGGLAGYWMGRCLRLERKASLLCALAAGVYCTIPYTEAIPLATLVGAYARFRESGREAPPDEEAGIEPDEEESAVSDGVPNDNQV
jgi:hypothetical protein